MANAQQEHEDLAYRLIQETMDVFGRGGTSESQIDGAKDNLFFRVQTVAETLAPGSERVASAIQEFQKFYNS